MRTSSGVAALPVLTTADLEDPLAGDVAVAPDPRRQRHGGPLAPGGPTRARPSRSSASRRAPFRGDNVVTLTSPEWRRSARLVEVRFRRAGPRDDGRRAHRRPFHAEPARAARSPLAAFGATTPDAPVPAVAPLPSLQRARAGPGPGRGRPGYGHEPGPEAVVSRLLAPRERCLARGCLPRLRRPHGHSRLRLRGRADRRPGRGRAARRDARGGRALALSNRQLIADALVARWGRGAPHTGRGAGARPRAQPGRPRGPTGGPDLPLRRQAPLFG